MGIKSKKAIFFSIDAFIALGILFIFIFMGYVIVLEKADSSKVHYDVLKTLSTLKVSEFDNAYVQSLVSSGAITNPDITLLEAIGNFYVSNKTIATNITNEVLLGLDVKENIGIWYGPSLISVKNTTSLEKATSIQTAKQFVTGICDERTNTTCGVTGFSARAFLSSSSRTKYTYLGGYVGDGNITLTTAYEGNITKAVLELAINKAFEVYINNNLIGSFAGSPDTKTPVNYTLPINLFQSGTNSIEIKGNNLYIAGGFLKILYEGGTEQEQIPKYYFPGIKGIINLYDGFYVPGTLNDLKISLHYDSPYEIALVMGNKTIYENASNGNTTVSLTNSYLSSILDYNELSNKTTPLRLWLKNISYVTQGGNGEIDVVLITDVSGSMDWNMTEDYSESVIRNCNDPLLTSPSTQRLSLAKCIDKDFVATILNSSTNSRIALVSFSSHANTYTSLTRNQTLLNNTINSYLPDSATCISCAINRAYQILESESSPERPKAILVMSDGVANRRSTLTCTNFNGVGGYNPQTIAAGATDGKIVNRNEATEAWNLLAQASTQINDLDFLNSTLAFAVGNSGVLLQWNGSAWNSLVSPTTENLNGIDIYNKTFALAVGNKGRVIKWNGVSWSAPQALGQSPPLNDVSIFSPNLMFIGGARSGSGRVYKSTNSGSSWSIDNSNLGTVVRGVKTISSNLAFAIGNDGNIWKWNGNSWNLDSSPTTQDLYGIDGTSSTNLFAAGGDFGNAIITSYNGNSWSLVYNTNGKDTLRDIVSFNDAAFTVGDGGLIVEHQSSQWNQNFNVPPAYEGTSTSGLSCTGDEIYCSTNNTFASLNAKYSSCRANDNLNATVYSVGFGPVTTCGFAANTLQSIADCGEGDYYASTNASELQQFYANIAHEFIQIAYGEQTSNVSGNISTRLYEDSYIEFNYTKKEVPFGLRATIEQIFTNKTAGLLNVPIDAFTVDTQLASYSGPLWTKEVKSNSQTVYNINDYGQDYVKIGDPYNIHIPSSTLNSSNLISMLTGSSPANSSEGSQYNKIIHTFVKNSTGYSPIVALAEGCTWAVEFNDASNTTLIIPKNYTGANACQYTFAAVSYEQNDALQTATYNLLKTLDINSDNRLDVYLTQNDVQIDLSQLTGVPFTWSTEVQVRTWI